MRTCQQINFWHHGRASGLSPAMASLQAAVAGGMHMTPPNTGQKESTEVGTGSHAPGTCQREQGLSAIKRALENERLCVINTQLEKHLYAELKWADSQESTESNALRSLVRN